MNGQAIRFAAWFSLTLLLMAALLTTLWLNTIRAFDFPFGGLYLMVVGMSLLACMFVASGSARYHLLRWRENKLTGGDTIQ